eukprot:2319761-Pleurochrysis_carterae.AAC.1
MATGASATTGAASLVGLPISSPSAARTASARFILMQSVGTLRLCARSAHASVACCDAGADASRV